MSAVRPASPAHLAQALLGWYDRHRRRLPWRTAPGVRPDPYRVWLSEIMLQQTTVPVVAGYFQRFLERWPTLESLALAELDDVLHAWQGLGYYARARNLHACARQLATDHGGHFPTEEKALRALPGIGRYTAAAIAAIAYDRPATVVDGNVERVIARLRAVESPLPAAKPKLYALAAELTPEARPGDYAQALMDLGATVCTPRNPGCLACPWQSVCEGRARGLAESLPRRAPKRQRPLRHGVSFWLMRTDGAVLLRRRPDEGLLGGMIELPTTPWRDEPWNLAEASAHAPQPLTWQALPEPVRHGFTHFEIELLVAAAEIEGGSANESDGAIWCPPARFSEHALPTLTRKLVRYAERYRPGPASTPEGGRR
ncbi:MAG: A/G-specific adenine glycosylase [Rhodospirillales bacterium]|nr:A/G-specific adenine glycosylase [Rhodospirillales bacterium]